MLLVHGTRDLNVNFKQSVRMHAALTRAGKSSELLRFDGLAHNLDDSAARARMLGAIADFLDAKLK